MQRKVTRFEPGVVSGADVVIADGRSRVALGKVVVEAAAANASTCGSLGLVADVRLDSGDSITLCAVDPLTPGVVLLRLRVENRTDHVLGFAGAVFALVDAGGMVHAPVPPGVLASLFVTRDRLVPLEGGGVVYAEGARCGRRDLADAGALQARLSLPSPADVRILPGMEDVVWLAFAVPPERIEHLGSFHVGVYDLVTDMHRSAEPASRDHFLFSLSSQPWTRTVEVEQVSEVTVVDSGEPGDGSPAPITAPASPARDAAGAAQSLDMTDFPRLSDHLALLQASVGRAVVVRLQSGTTLTGRLGGVAGTALMLVDAESGATRRLDALSVERIDLP